MSFHKKGLIETVWLALVLGWNHQAPQKETRMFDPRQLLLLFTCLFAFWASDEEVKGRGPSVPLWRDQGCLGIWSIEGVASLCLRSGSRSSLASGCLVLTACESQCEWWIPRCAALAICRTAGSHALKTRWREKTADYAFILHQFVVHFATLWKIKDDACGTLSAKPPRDGSIASSFTLYSLMYFCQQMAPQFNRLWIAALQVWWALLLSQMAYNPLISPIKQDNTFSGGNCKWTQTADCVKSKTVLL